MTRISSRMTWVYKRAFPVLWIAILVVALIGILASGLARQEPAVVVVPIVMAPIGFFLIRRFTSDLADEVHDGGDYLRVQYRGEEDRVALSNVMNVDSSPNAKPPRVTLTLISPSRFGSEIAFIPAHEVTLNPFAKCKLAEDLMVRAHHARSARAD